MHFFHAPSDLSCSDLTFCGPCGSQRLGRLWIQFRWARLSLSSGDIDSALAALMQGLLEIIADELETLLKDLPVPVKEAVEASLYAIEHVIKYVI